MAIGCCGASYDSAWGRKKPIRCRCIYGHKDNYFKKLAHVFAHIITEAGKS